jgi:hypothetical protein
MNDNLLLAIIGNLVGDYLLQNDWMALNKKSRSFPCVVHCTLWTVAVCMFAGWYKWQVVSILFLTHFIQDRTQIIQFWMKTIGQSKFGTPPMAPWSLVIVDNVWHIVTIWAVWRFIS